MSKFRPRLTIDVTEEQYWALVKLIPDGFRNMVFQSIVEDLVKMLSNVDIETRAKFFGLLAHRDISLKELLPSLGGTKS